MIMIIIIIIITINNDDNNNNYQVEQGSRDVKVADLKPIKCLDQHTPISS